MYIYIYIVLRIYAYIDVYVVLYKYMYLYTSLSLVVKKGFHEYRREMEMQLHNFSISYCRENLISREARLVSVECIQGHGEHYHWLKSSPESLVVQSLH